jgi:hypothetical protein
MNCISPHECVHLEVEGCTNRVQRLYMTIICVQRFSRTQELHTVNFATWSLVTWLCCIIKKNLMHPHNVQASPESIGRLAEGEVINGRWAMAACVGCLTVELFGFGNWFDAPLWAVNGTAPTYFGVTVPFDITTIILVEIVLMAGAELLRGNQEDPVKRIYPGTPPLQEYYSDSPLAIISGRGSSASSAGRVITPCGCLNVQIIQIYPQGDPLLAFSCSFLAEQPSAVEQEVCQHALHKTP